MWIDHVPPEQADKRLKKLLDQLADGRGRVEQVYLVHSLRPSSLEGHLALYRGVLPHSGNEVPKWFLEAIGILVSRLNGCDYCVAHHSQGLRRAVDHAPGAEAFLEALAEAAPEKAAIFSSRDRAALAYAAQLTRNPRKITRADIQALRDAGWNDGEILEINQVAAYFAYANRTVLGLGLELEAWNQPDSTEIP